MMSAYDLAPADSWSFAITSTVTWCNGPHLVLKDESGSCNLYNGLRTALSRGDMIIATGKAHMTVRQDPWIDELEITRIGFKQLPVPEKVDLKDCADPRLELEGVRVEATVVDVCTDELGDEKDDALFDWLILKDSTAMIAVGCPHDEGNSELIDARIEVSGPICRHVEGARNFVNPYINAQLGGSIKLVAPPTRDPFDYPTLQFSRSASPAEIEQLDKHVVTGKIIATWPVNNCLLMTHDYHFIRLVMAANEPMPPCYSLVRAVGYPSSDLFTYWLTRTKIRIEDLPDIPLDEPLEVSSEILYPRHDRDRASFGRNLDNRLISISGLVKGIESHSDGTLRVFLKCKGAPLPVDFSTYPDDFNRMAVGNEVKVTGRCIMMNERWNPNNVFPRISGLLLVLTDKPEILRGPSWWTTGRLLSVIVLLLIALVIAMLRNAYAKRLAQTKINERTQLAVEIHDSLSQTLTGLACHITAAQKTIGTDTPTAEKKLTTANQMLLSCRTELRNCLFDLRNDTLSEKDFSKAVIRTLEPFDDSVTLFIRFNAPRARFDDNTAHGILAIIRELTANAVRHGNAWTVKVAGTIENDVLFFSVTDDGSGFDFDHRKDSEEGHFGLDGIRERLKRLDGSLTFKAPRNGGTKAIVRIPIHRS